MKRKWWMLALAVLLLSVAAVNAQLSRDFSDEFLDSATGRALIQTYGALKSNYLNDVDDEMVIQGAINGMLEALEDPYTRYSTPEDAAREMEQRGGSFQGIGATIAPLDRESGTGVEVINVYRNSPAWNAGIQKGRHLLPSRRCRCRRRDPFGRLGLDVRTQRHHRRDRHAPPRSRRAHPLFYRS